MYDNYETLLDNALEGAIIKNRLEGRQDWLLEEWRDSWRRGWLKGWKEGCLEVTIRIAGNLKRESLTIEFIAKVTSLSIEEIEKL